MTDLERVKQSLQEEFERMSHTQYDLLGNTAYSRIIRAPIMAYILESATLSTCRNEVKSLMIGLVFLKKALKKKYCQNFVHYKAKELINNGYFKCHKE